MTNEVQRITSDLLICFSFSRLRSFMGGAQLHVALWFWQIEIVIYPEAGPIPQPAGVMGQHVAQPSDHLFSALAGIRIRTEISRVFITQIVEVVHGRGEIIRIQLVRAVSGGVLDSAGEIDSNVPAAFE